MPSRITVRNPYPIPDVASEGFWLRAGPVLGSKVSLTDRAWSNKLDPHERLFAHHTLNSIRRDHRLVRTEAPNDSLDFALTASYVHNEDTLVPKMYVPMQPESMGRETWRVLRNEIQASSLQSGITIFGEHGETGEIVGEETISSGDSNNGQSDSIGSGSKVRRKGGKKQQRGSGAISGRAASAPHHSAQRGPPGQLHRYAGKSHHIGIPDRIERIHPSSLKLAIEGPHTDQTNAGYSRKDDGTFYGV